MAEQGNNRPIGAAESLAAGLSTIPPHSPSEPIATTSHELHHLPPAREGRGESSKTIPTLPPNAPELTRTTSHASHAPSDSSPPPQAPLSTARLFAIAATATLCMVMSSAGNISLNIALPTIQHDLDMRETDLQWISSAYSLTYGCFLLLSGRLADIHGRKLVFLCGVSWYTLWTMLGPFFKNGAGLVVSRALTGCGAALATPSAIGIIGSTFTGQARANAFATLAAGAPIGGGIGLVIGGLLTTYAPTTWRAALWVMAGVSALIAICGYFVFPSDILTTSDRRVDWIGAALVTVGLIFVQFSVSGGQAAPHGWKTSYIIALLVIGVILVAVFFFWERRVMAKVAQGGRPPLMRTQLWTRAKGRLAAVYVIGFITWMGFISISYHSTLFYQQVQLLSPVQAMVRFLPMSVSGVICNVIVAKSVAHVPTQILVCIGILATGIASVLFAVSPADVNYWRLPFHGMWLCVLGADFLMATGMLFISKLALPGEQSVAGALFQTLVQLGGSFGLAITSVISSVYQQKALDTGRNVIDSLLNGIHAAFWLASGCSFFALLVALIALRGMGTIGKPDKGAEVKPAKRSDEESAGRRVEEK